MKSKSIKETYKFASDFVKNVKKRERAVVVGLQGDLGSGKTTFMQGVAKYFGVEGNVTSPTFVIEKVYDLNNQTFDKLIHMDAYRIDSLKGLKFDEISNNPNSIIFIEWPENVKVDCDDIINFEFINKNTRKIWLTKEKK